MNAKFRFIAAGTGRIDHWSECIDEKNVRLVQELITFEQRLDFR